jgi:hypothetical protein
VIGESDSKIDNLVLKSGSIDYLMLLIGYSYIWRMENTTVSFVHFTFHYFRKK